MPYAIKPVKKKDKKPETKKNLKPMFPVGSYVFAKMRGFPPWPARVKGVKEVRGQFKYHVRYYGSYDFSENCSENALFPYNERVKERNAEKSTRGRHQEMYNRAIKEIEEDLALFNHKDCETEKNRLEVVFSSVTTEP